MHAVVPRKLYYARYDMAGATNFTGWKVREKILQLAVPY